ncbi:hypothetical protein evm_012872 [Chilo suppressalis]|nr:hypothetical protein evm_012872 [Chilo suppressalis]
MQCNVCLYLHNSTMMLKILAVLLGVALGVVLSDQSASIDSEEQPMGEQQNSAGKGRVETPEVVLQLKYDRGGLNRIYLAQFRKGRAGWRPSVAARSELCADLCHAGLGGRVCGQTCDELMPVGLKTALRNASDTSETYGQPRVDVCPALCKNMLGQPLCSCEAPTEENDASVDWSDICQAFCISDNYVLRGCPACDPNAIAPHNAVRTLNTVDGWVAWCNVQCRQGQGGAACNCDRGPLS